MNVQVPRSARSSLGVLALFLLAVALTGCSEPQHPSSSAPTTTRPSSPASDTIVATIESRDASEALRAYMDGWMRDFNRDAVGSDVGTAPLDAATAVPLDRHDIVTLSEFTFEPVGGGPPAASRFVVTCSFWRGNPLSSSYPAQPLSSSSTYEVSRDGQSNAWVITLVSAPPDSNPQPVTPK